MNVTMLSVFYLSLFCGVLSLLFESLPQKKARGAFRTVCTLAALAAVVFSPLGDIPKIESGENKDAYFETLGAETAASVFREAERCLGEDLSARLENEFSAPPLLCTVKLDRESAAVTEVAVLFSDDARLVSGYQVKMFVSNLYGKTVKTEVKWNGEAAS